MRIRDVMRLTGLTRKAIYYYEQAGLIAPGVDPDNQYRIYGDEDVETLRYIASSRKVWSARDSMMGSSNRCAC